VGRQVIAQFEILIALFAATRNFSGNLTSTIPRFSPNRPCRRNSWDGSSTRSLSRDAPLQSDWSVTVEGDEDDRLPKASPERMCGFLSASRLTHLPADSLQVTGDG
jgi:hypothetical protein